MSRKKPKTTKTTKDATTEVQTPAPDQHEWIARAADLRILGRVQAGTEDEALASAKEQYEGAEAVEPTLADQDLGVQEPVPEDAPAEQPATEAPVEQTTPDAPAEHGEIAVEPQATSETPPTEAPAEAATPTDGEVATSSAPDQSAEAPAKKRTRRTSKPKAEPAEKKLSALDAAAKVLAESGTAMSCQELILAMAEKGYWSSPAGKTPAATLYSALLRETQTKCSSSRFVKADRGKFALRAVE